MENQPSSPHQTAAQPLSLYIDPSILEDFPILSSEGSGQQRPQDAKLIIQKKQNRLWVSFPDGEICDFPYYLKNIQAILGRYRTPASDVQVSPGFENFLKSAHSLEKKVFSSVPAGAERNIKDLWDEIIRKINSISTESHSLSDLVKNLLEVPFLQSFQTSLLVLHLKGQTRAELLGTLWRSEKVRSLVEVREFNTFFNSIKKSKIKSFSTDSFPKLNLPFNGSFLAKEVTSRKYSLVAITSRHDFLSYSKDEIDLFETCIGLLQPHFERLVDQEFSDQRISELRLCLKDFPLPLRILNLNTGTSFQNDLYHPELQEKDIFFNKKIRGPFALDLYDSDELRHYAFDLFHFQRISLLGELLNTLRHELSNPLFGLKLSSQIFGTLEVDQDSKEIMKEIEKNVSRCQLIMENFSSLYQIQHEKKAVSLKKIIDESLVLSKSELREIKKSITYQEGAEDLELDVPLIFVVQILFNLIVNSAQALKQAQISGELGLSIERDADTVSIHVTDNGPGIPDEQLAQLFKPFFTTKAQGTGLGLLLSRNLALKMGGNLEYLVNNNRNGAHFKLTLPLK